MSDRIKPEHASPQPQPAPLRVDPPRSIRTSVLGMWVGAAMSIIYVPVWYLELKTLNANNTAELEEKYGDQLISSDSLLDAGMTISIGINTLAALVAVAIWIAMAIINSRGIAWARIVATILGVLGVLNTGFAALAASSEGVLIPTSVIYYTVNLALIVTIIGNLWLPKSSAFYKASSAQRKIT